MTKHILKDVEGFKKRTDLFYVDPNKIKIVPGWNGRKDFSDLQELMDSIEEVGVLQPLTVRKNEDKMLELIAGERRLRSVLRLNSKGCDITSIPVIVRSSKVSEIDLYIESVIENTGKPLTPVEESESFKKLIAWGISREEIAKKCGRSLSHVRNRLELSAAIPAVKKAVEEKKITVKAAQEIVQKSDGKVDKQIKNLEVVESETKEVKQEKRKAEKIEKQEKKKTAAMKEYGLKMVLFKLYRNISHCGPNILDLTIELRDLLFDNEDAFNAEYNACKDKL